MNVIQKRLVMIAATFMLSVNLVQPSPVAAQTLDDSETILKAALEFLELLGIRLFKSTSDANVNDDYFGVQISQDSTVEDNTGDFCYPDVVGTWEEFRERIDGELEDAIYAPNPTIMASLGADRVLFAMLEDILNEPLTLEGQEDRSFGRQQHLSYLEETLGYSQATAELSFNLAEAAFSYDTQTPINQLVTASNAAQTASATQDVLKHIATAMPIYGEQTAQTNEILQLMSNQLTLMNDSSYYTLASIFATQTNIEEMMEEERLDRAITAQMYLRDASRRSNDESAQQIKTYMDLINNFESLGVVGYSFGVPEENGENR